jgi:hypothetical protein
MTERQKDKEEAEREKEYDRAVDLPGRTQPMEVRTPTPKQTKNHNIQGIYMTRPFLFLFIFELLVLAINENIPL